MTTTIEKGNAFRDLVVSMLEAAGFVAESEVRIAFKKVDVRWRREEIDGPVRYLVEAKDYGSALGLDVCREFSTEYGTLLDSDEADKAWLVSRGPLSPDGRALVDAKRGLKAMTFDEFQRRLLGMDKYLQDLITSYESSRTADWYVQPHTSGGDDLEEEVRRWMLDDDALPLAIIAGYGKGKSTFARHFAASLAREALKDQSRRLPILVPLGDIVDEQSLEGLLGKVFASGPVARGYNFGLFEKLNRVGRFVIIFDGFDEMKHGMTLSRFESMIVELMRLDRDKAKLIILGRDTAFQDDYEFRSIILGRQITAGGQEVAAPGRRAFRQIQVRDFTLDEAKGFVKKFFPIVAYEAARGAQRLVDARWIETRTAELVGGAFDVLLVRPVHAQMLCQIATDDELTLSRISKFRLFDLFVHFLLDREVKKRGRDDRFSLEVRRQFNRALALWLWQQGGISTVTLSSVPADLCHRATKEVSHDYDDTSLRKELTAGCLIEKGSSGTIYFGHRSLQEFLVAEELIATDLAGSVTQQDQNAALWYLSLVTPEVSSFIVDAAMYVPSNQPVVVHWADIMDGLRRKDMPRSGMRLFVELFSEMPKLMPSSTDPWMAWMHYFISNRGVDFAPRSVRAADEFISLCSQNLKIDREQQGAALLLASEVLSRDSEYRTQMIGPFIAAWLDPAMLRSHIQAARHVNNRDHYYVDQDHISFWAFLHSGSISANPPNISIDLRELRRRVTSVFQFGFSESEELEASEYATITLPVQNLYRIWALREAELERIRPYFGPGLHRSKIIPLEVVRTGRPREPEPVQAPKALKTYEKLGLKGRPKLK